MIRGILKTYLINFIIWNYNNKFKNNIFDWHLSSKSLPLFYGLLNMKKEKKG